jgi:DHA1 family tetracycline resistance protein-like MFS transporter
MGGEVRKWDEQKSEFTSVALPYCCSTVFVRIGVQILSLFFIALSPISLLLIQIYHSIHPTWFFVAESLSSIIHILSIGFTQLTDVVAPHHRAAAYGMFFGAFMGGIAVAPFFAAMMSHIHVAVFSCLVRISALFIAVLFLPETLSLEKRTVNSQHQEKRRRGVVQNSIHTMLRPFREMAILLRSTSLMLLATGAFLSKMVFSADVTLFFFYVESNLGVTDTDVAGMMFVTGLLGVLVQAVLLKYLISLLGERGLLLASFCSGTVHNLIYGLAPKKWMLYFGLCLSQLSNTNNPLISSLASKCVADTEQGRIQGALFSLTSLAEAIGPICFNFVYHHFNLVGPGTMFLFGAVLYSLGLVAVWCIPKKKNTDMLDEEGITDDETDLLLS